MVAIEVESVEDDSPAKVLMTAVMVGWWHYQTI